MIRLAALCLLACLTVFPALSPARTALADDARGAGRFVVARDDGHDLRPRAATTPEGARHFGPQPGHGGHRPVAPGQMGQRAHRGRP
jgi:hypothetical protein